MLTSLRGQTWFLMLSPIPFSWTHLWQSTNIDIRRCIEQCSADRPDRPEPDRLFLCCRPFDAEISIWSVCVEYTRLDRTGNRSHDVAICRCSDVSFRCRNSFPEDWYCGTDLPIYGYCAHSLVAMTRLLFFLFFFVCTLMGCGGGGGGVLGSFRGFIWSSVCSWGIVSRMLI